MNPATVIIKEGAMPMGQRLRELWAYRELLYVLTLRDIKVRYKQTVLGAAWAILQPVATMVVFTIFFGRLAGVPSDGYPYPVFVFAALLPWTFFANGVSNTSTSVVSASNLVSKVYFPRLHIPLASIGASLLDLVISLSVLVGLMIWYQVLPTWQLAALPLLTAIAMLSALGVGIWLAALNVSYRDFRYVIPFMIQIWMFCTPVVYGQSLIPERWQWVMALNPMTGVVEGYRSAILGRPFDYFSISLSLGIGLLVFLAGVAYFERVEDRFADVI